MAEYEKQFNYLVGNTGKEQLYYDFHLWYKVRANYWRCSTPGCNSFLSTNGDSLKHPNKSPPPHLHEATSPDEFKIKKHLNCVIKERVRNEIHTWPSLIFNEEVKRLQNEQNISAQAIAMNLKPYSNYKSGFDAIRAINKQKKPTTKEQQAETSKIEKNKPSLIKRKNDDRGSPDEESLEQRPAKKATLQPQIKANTTLRSDEKTEILSDEQIVAGLRLLSEQYSELSGYTVRFQKDLSKTLQLHFDDNTTFILHCNGNKWVAIKRINNRGDDKWLLYESFDNETNLKDIRKDLQRIDNTQSGTNGKIEVFPLDIQGQESFGDLGLFAIACAYEICNGNDPENVLFKQNEMRSHYQRCLDDKKFSAFPQDSRVKSV